MAVREDEDIPLQGTKPGHDAVGPCADRVRRFAAGAAIAEQKPVRPFLMNVRRALALVSAVVPFDQIGIHLGLRSETGQLASTAGTLQGTGQDLNEVLVPQARAKMARVTFAVLGGGDVRDAGT